MAWIYVKSECLGYSVNNKTGEHENSWIQTSWLCSGNFSQAGAKSIDLLAECAINGLSSLTFI